MRILILNYEFPPLGGGAGNATFYLLKEFSKQPGLKIDLITSSIGKYNEEQFSNNIKIYYLDIGKKSNLHYQSNFKLLKYSFKSYFLAKKLKKQNKYDLVHAFFGIPCGFVAMRLGLPYIVSLRGSDAPFYNKRFYFLDKLIFKRLSKKIWRRARTVVANSQGLKNLALKTAPQQKIEVIYNGVDTNDFQSREKENDVFTIISTSRLIERKGIEYLLDAFVRFNKKYKDSRLLLVGGGNLEKEMKNKAYKIGIADKVEFLGALRHRDIAKYYNKADVFVLASLNEGMSNSLLEAMASGLPIIATNTGGTKELVDEQNGIIVRKQNSQDIFNALEKLYLDRNLLKNMSSVSRQKAEGMSWSSAAERYYKLYKN